MQDGKNSGDTLTAEGIDLLSNSGKKININNIYVINLYNNNIYLVSGTIKNEFSKMGAMHVSNSSVHLGPPSSAPNKRVRKQKAKKGTIELEESDNEDNPFTLKTKGGGLTRHEITIRHEHDPTPLAASTSNIPTIPSTSATMSTSSTAVLIESNSKVAKDPKEVEATKIDRRIQVLDSIISTFKTDDVRAETYQEQKRELLLKKLCLIVDDDSM